MLGSHFLVWGIIMRLQICLAALAAATALASPAAAQTATASADAEARGLVLQPLTLTKASDLNFGTVIASNVAGTVSIDPDSGNRSTTGGVTGVPTDVGTRALFAGAGTAGQPVLLTLNAPALLVSTTDPTDTVAVSSMTLDNSNATFRTIGVTAAFQVGVGGTFAIAASQPNGLYVADFDLTADYQ